MEAKGKVIQVMPTETGTSKNGKDWSKTTFVIETGDTYPKKIAIDVLGDKVKLPKVGDDVTISLNVESREYNGKWYTNVTAWKIEKMGSGAPAAPAHVVPNDAAESDINLPF